MAFDPVIARIRGLMIGSSPLTTSKAIRSDRMLL
jgi:hypothetical protein